MVYLNRNVGAPIVCMQPVSLYFVVSSLCDMIYCVIDYLLNCEHTASWHCMNKRQYLFFSVWNKPRTNILTTDHYCTYITQKLKSLKRVTNVNQLTSSVSDYTQGSKKSTSVHSSVTKVSAVVLNCQQSCQWYYQLKVFQQGLSRWLGS